jgi:1-aminocyclopropane-1-carboxylate deaminase/D-cysteine desulfhydrase-like pyridoxal-dependent ACC family enzyme
MGLGAGGMTKTVYGDVVQILAEPNHFLSVGAIVDNTAKDANAKCLAGVPLYGDLRQRGGGVNAFVKPTTNVSAVAGVYTVTLKTAATAGDVITVEGVDYTAAAAESVANKEFAGANAAAQVTSLLKMIVCNDFVVAAVGGASTKIGFTQKVAKDGNEPLIAGTAVAGTGTLVLGAVTKVTDPVEAVGSNANCVLLHETDFTGESDANGVVVIHGVINLSRLATATAEMYTDSVIAALAARGIYVI